MITVVTPVYNAEKYLVKTIESVLSQNEVSEYILVDDGSNDDSWEIIKLYQNKDSRVKGVKHPDQKNHGRSKTKNIGINQASNNLIAFLDADDFYLPNRFKNDIKILNGDNSIDGVYNALGIYFYDTYEGDKNIPHVLTTLKEEVKPENLFESMSPIGRKGWFSGDAFIVKKNALLEVGMFNPNLSVAEDTELWSKLSLKYKLVPGNLKIPVAKRGVHDNNVFNKGDKYRKPRLIMYQSLLIWASNNETSKSRINILIIKYLNYLKKYSGKNFVIYSVNWLNVILKSPKLLFNKKYLKALIIDMKSIFKKFLKGLNS